ncbi:S1/P1 nuclease [Oxalobacteraceae bacterium A2-2]
MNKLACIVALSGAFVSFNAQAWGFDGHRAVGAIADQLLKGTPAEKHVQALLLPGESLEKVSTWADCVKGTYCGPQTAEMTAYTAANPKHSEYHYTDVPFQNEHYHDHDAGTADVDIVQTLKQAIAVLQGKDTEESNPHHFTQRQALLLVTHLTGDIAQPLHVGAAFVGADGGFVVPKKPSDIDGLQIFNAQGGNNLLMDDVKLTANSERLIPAAPAKEGGDNAPATPNKALTKPFHSYWDSTVVNYAFRRIGVRTPEQFAQAVIATHPVVAANTGDPATWPYQWADDTLVAAKAAHVGVVPGQMAKQTSRSTGEAYSVWKLTVPDDYPVPSSAAAKEQLIKGGYRLAALLQAIWPN